jgi:UDP:flavonoid glycosyltransferase YjiC (YdhE family)
VKDFSMKALFVPFAPSLAHVTRCLSVAEAWRDAGHEAVFAVGSERTKFISENGYEVHEVPEIPKQVFLSDRGFRWLTKEYLSANIEKELSIIRAVKPDAVVYDFRFSTGISSHMAGCLAVGITHGNAAMLADQPGKTAALMFGPAGGTKRFDPRSAVLSRVFPLGFGLIMRIASRSLNGYLRRCGMKPVSVPFQVLLGEKTLVADIPELVSQPMRDTAHIVGPLLWSGWSRPEPLLSELGDAPLIYVTMGTTVEASAPIVRLVECLRGLPYNAIITTGGAAIDVKSVPKNIRIVPYVSGQTVVEHSKLVIYHGGHGTLMQALAAGVPSLVIPFNPDQIILARRIADLKFGKSLRKPDAFPMDPDPLGAYSKAEISALIDATIRDQDIQMSCKRAQQSVQSFRGTNAVSLIEKFIAEKYGRKARSG